MVSIKAKAFSLLARKSYFSKELEKKLLEKKYPQKEIATLIKELGKNGWLNDEELTARYVEGQRAKGYGARVIAYKLREKAGIELSLEESEESLRDFILRKHAKNLPEKRDKVIASLMRRGFSYELINKALASIS